MPLMMLGLDRKGSEEKKNLGNNQEKQRERQRVTTPASSSSRSKKQDNNPPSGGETNSANPHEETREGNRLPQRFPHSPLRAEFGSIDHIKNLWEKSKNKEPYMSMFRKAGVSSLEDLLNNEAKRAICMQLFQKELFRKNGIFVSDPVDGSDLNLNNPHDQFILQQRLKLAGKSADFERTWIFKEIATEMVEELFQKAGSQGEELLQKIQIFQDEQGTIFTFVEPGVFDFNKNRTHAAILQKALLNFASRNGINEDLVELNKKTAKSEEAFKSVQFLQISLNALEKQGFDLKNLKNVKKLLEILNQNETTSLSATVNIELERGRSPSLDNLSIKKLVFLKGEQPETVLLYCRFPEKFNPWENPNHDPAIKKLVKDYVKDHLLKPETKKRLFIFDASGEVIEYSMLPQMSFLEKARTAFRNRPLFSLAFTGAVAFAGKRAYDHVNSYAPSLSHQGGPKAYCDSYLGQKLAPNSRIENPSWVKFSATPETVCREIVQQPKKNLKFLFEELHQWGSSILDRFDQHERSVVKTSYIAKQIKEVSGVFADCYQHWGCPRAAFESAKHTFDQQKTAISLLNTRVEREQQFNSLNYSYYSGPSDSKTLKNLQKETTSLTSLLSKEKGLADKAQKFKDPDSQKQLFSKKQKDVFKKYYQAEKEILEGFERQLAEKFNQSLEKIAQKTSEF